MTPAVAAASVPDMGDDPAQPALDLRWTTYGQAAYDLLVSVVAELKGSDPLTPITLLVPTDLCGVAARRELARSTAEDRTGIAALSVMTVPRLAELLAAPSLIATGRRPLTAPLLAAAWRQSLSSEPGVFRPVAAHPATVTALVSAHRHLRDLSDEQLSTLDSAGTVTREVVRLHRQVQQATSADWYDTTDLLHAAAEAADKTLLTGLGRVILFLLQDLPPAAAQFLSSLASTAGLLVVAATTGNARADAGVRRSLALLGVHEEPPSVQPPVASRVVHASDSDDEVRAVVRDVVARLEIVPAHRMAILYGNRSPYARLLHESLGAAGIAVNGPGVRSAAERSFPRAFLELLEALDSPSLDRPTLFRILAGAPFRDGAGRRVPVSRWARVSRAAGVTDQASWQPRLDLLSATARGSADSYEDDEDWRRERALREADDAEGLLAFVVALLESGQHGKSLTTWRETSAWAIDLLRSRLGDDEIRLRLPDDERRAGDALERILLSLAGLDAVEQSTSLAALREVLTLEIDGDLSRVGSFGTGLLVAPLGSAAGLVLDVVFVVGLAEGLAPTAVNDDPLIPDEARELVPEVLAPTRERIDSQHRALLAAFACAHEVVASFPRGDLRASGGRIPSRWLLPTLRDISGDPALASTDWEKVRSDRLAGSPSYASSVVSAPMPATEQEWRQRALDAGGAAALRSADVAFDRALELRAARASDRFTRFDGNLSGVASALPDLADGQRQHSPTSLEQWVACPHAYFVQRLLKVRAVEEPETGLAITPMERGNLMHAALDEFFQWLQSHGGAPASSQPWTKAQRDQLQAIASVVADSFQARGVTGHPVLWQRDRTAILRDLDLVLSQDERVRTAEGRQQVHAELRFSGETAVPVELGDGRTMLLTGSVDRIDVTPHGLAVVDYKSGSARKFEGLDADNPDAAGTKLQLPVYAYAARQQQQTPNAPVRSEYWFIGPRNRGERIGYELNDEIEARYAMVLTTILDGVGGGVFPHNPPEPVTWGNWVTCPFCDVDALGADAHQHRWDRKKHDPALTAYLSLVEPGPEEKP